MNNIEKARALLQGSQQTITVGSMPMNKRLLTIVTAAVLSIFSYHANKAFSSTQTEDNHSISIQTTNNVQKTEAVKNNEFIFAKKADVLAKIFAQQNENHKAELSFTVTNDDNVDTLIKKSLEAKQEFLALALRMEDPRRKVYYDVCGANIGLGYCLTSNVADKGKEAVIQDLSEAGISQDNIKILINDKVLNGKKRSLAKDVVIDMSSVVKLTVNIQKSYENIARISINTAQDNFWDKLDTHKQAALTYLAYNVGENLIGFNRLIGAIRKSTEDLNSKQKAINDMVIYKNLAPWFRDMETGTMVKNERADAYITMAMYSSNGLSYAVTHPNVVESQSSSKSTILKIAKENSKVVKQHSNIDDKALQQLNNKELISSIPNLSKVSEKIANQKSATIQQSKITYNQKIKY